MVKQVCISKDETSKQHCAPPLLGSEVSAESLGRVNTLAGTGRISGEPL